MILGLIPAAGKSERMGRPKLQLRVGGGTVLDQVVNALRAGGVDHVLVVVAPQADELRRIADAAGADVLMLPEQTMDMRATVQDGLDWLQTRYSPASTDYWLLAPADHPAMDADVIRRLIDGAREVPSGSVLIPIWQGRRGHPVLIPWSHVEAIRGFPPNQGLNAYLRQCAGLVHEVPALTASILQDLDTPEDYERLLRDATAP
jgi:molybdenum cofactor cytidylyltransferase